MPDTHPLTGQTVLVRDNRAGIHVGTLVDLDLAARTCVLTGARKIWYWTGAAACHGLAVHGPGEGSKICPAVTRVESCDVVEVVAVNEDAAAKIAEFPEWSP